MLGWIIAVVEPIVAWLANRWPAFARLINGVLIDGIVKQTRGRPHPWSTRTDYISWIGLTDRTYSARHLPAADFGPYPSLEQATALFARPTGEQVLCPKSTLLFPTFAQYLTDGFIRTKVSNDDALTDRRRTTSNHEIDLCPLYGRLEAQTLALRLRSPNPAERGRLRVCLTMPSISTPLISLAKAGQRLASQATIGSTTAMIQPNMPCTHES